MSGDQLVLNPDDFTASDVQCVLHVEEHAHAKLWVCTRDDLHHFILAHSPGPYEWRRDNEEPT